MVNRQLICPACGEEDELTGAPGPDGIQITCEKCGATWPRDATPVRCASCGGDDIEFRPQPLTAYSRGTQVSIIGWRQLPLCVTCDAAMLTRSLAGKPVPNTYQSAALEPRDPDTPTDLKILPR